MLLNDSLHVTERLIYLDTAKSGLAEAQKLSGLRQDLLEKAKSLNDLIAYRQLLQATNVPVSPVTDVATVRETVTRVKSLFKTTPKANILTQGSRWTNVISRLDALITTLKAVQIQDWKAFFAAQLFGGLPPEQRRTTINHNHPGNKKAIDRYSQLYTQLNRYRNTPPLTVVDLRQVLAASQELGEIKFVEISDMPTVVQRFFDASGSGLGANLELVNAEVIDWLRERDLLKSYVVRAKL